MIQLYTNIAKFAKLAHISFKALQILPKTVNPVKIFKEFKNVLEIEYLEKNNFILYLIKLKMIMNKLNVKMIYLVKVVTKHKTNAHKVILLFYAKNVI